MKRACPCGSGLLFARCCDIFLSGKTYPKTAEALMRSRYSAYVTHNIDYLVRTHEGAVDRAAIAAWAKKTTWRGLKIVATEDGGVDDATGVVEFVATYYADRREGTLHERSRFARRDGRWVYVDAQ